MTFSTLLACLWKRKDTLFYRWQGFEPQTFRSTLFSQHSSATDRIHHLASLPVQQQGRRRLQVFLRNPETPKFEIRAKETVCRSEEFFFSQQGPTSIKICHFYFVSVCKRSFLFVSHLALSHLARCSLVIDQVCGDNESRVRGKRGLHEDHCGLISRRNGKKIFYIIFCINISSLIGFWLPWI